MEKCQQLKINWYQYSFVKRNKVCGLVGMKRNDLSVVFPTDFVPYFIDHYIGHRNKIG